MMCKRGNISPQGIPTLSKIQAEHGAKGNKRGVAEHKTHRSSGCSKVIVEWRVYLSIASTMLTTPSCLVKRRVHLSHLAISSWNANRCPHRQTHPRGRAGLPITTEYGNTSLVTIAPAPTVENSPMFTPASMIAPAPNEAPLLTVVGNSHLRLVYLVLASANRGDLG